MSQIRGNWGDGISLFSGIVSVRHHKEPRAKKESYQDIQEEDFSMDKKDVIAMKPTGRLRWLQRALVLAGTGKLKTTVLYDVVTHPKFAARCSTEFRLQMGELLEANLHLFSSRQQRFLLAEVKEVSRPVAVGQKRSRSGSHGNERSPSSCDCCDHGRSHSALGETGQRQGHDQKEEDSPSHRRAAVQQEPPPSDSQAGVRREHSPEATRVTAERRRGQGDAPVLPSFLVMPPALPVHANASPTPPVPTPSVDPAAAAEKDEVFAAATDKLKQAAVVAATVAKAAAVAAQNLRMAAAAAASAAEVKETPSRSAGDGDTGHTVVPASATADGVSCAEVSSGSTVIAAIDRPRSISPGGHRSGVEHTIAGANRSSVVSLPEESQNGRPVSVQKFSKCSRSRSRGAGAWTSYKHKPKGSHRRGDSRARQHKGSHGRKSRRGKCGDDPEGKADIDDDAKTASSEPRERPQKGAFSTSSKLHKDKGKPVSSNWDDSGGDRTAAGSAATPVVAPAGAGIAGSIAPSPVQQPVVAPTLKVSSPFYRFLTIPVSHVGHLIGPRGACITSIRQASGADIKIDQPGGKLYATVAISGKGVDVAERLIYEKLASAPGMTLATMH